MTTPMTNPSRDASLPLVTIVTPSYNQGQFIRATIDSVLTQDYPAVEYLVVDGGSTDGTIDILRSYGDRVRWTSGPDAGQTDAIHRGFAAATGKYIAWLNSDDVYLPGAISAAVAELEAHPGTGLLYGGAEFIDRDGARQCALRQAVDREAKALLITVGQQRGRQADLDGRAIGAAHDSAFQRHDAMLPG